ncbi:MAG: HEAT repeat domain-containing protein [Planctomycetota bacterium]|jgi:hypothetical protein
MIRHTWLALVALAVLAGCAQQPGQDVWAKMAELAQKHNEDSLKARNHAEQMQQKIVDLNKRLTELEGRINLMLMDLEDLKKQGALGSAPTPKPEEQVPTDDEIQTTDKTLKALKSGEIDVTEAVKRLLPAATVAAPLLVDELRRYRADPEYAPKLERTLAAMPAAAVREPLNRALKEDALRPAAIRAVMNIGDFELSRILEPYFIDADEEQRLDLAVALVKCRNPVGLTPLVALLNSNEWHVRFLAFNELKKLNRDVSYDYNPHATDPTLNREAIKKWDEWLKKFGDKIFKQ